MLNALRQSSAAVLAMSRRAFMAGAWGGFDEALKRTEDIYLNSLMQLKDVMLAAGLYLLAQHNQDIHFLFHMCCSNAVQEFRFL